ACGMLLGYHLFHMFRVIPSIFHQCAKYIYYNQVITVQESTSFQFTQERKECDTELRQDPKATSTLSLEDAFETVQDQKKQNAVAFACLDEDIGRVRRLFSEIESRQTSVSAYDTAWVAMVPSMENSQSPQFPQCLRFIRENIGKIASEDKHNPTGFEIIFSAMLEDARGLCLELPYESFPLKLMLAKRKEILKRSWKKNEIVEGISSASDIVNSSVCFRILRWNGYDVSPVLKDGDFLPSVEKSGQAVSAMLNLYKASQVIFPGERILEEAKSFSRDYLAKSEAKSIMHDKNIVLKNLEEEIEYTIGVPWLSCLERIEHRRCIEKYGFDDIWIRKTSYKIPCISNEFFSNLAKKDYNICQALQQKDLQELEKWFIEAKFGNLHFARQKLVYCYFSVVSTLFSPEMSAARIAWTKNAVLTTVIDDFYDVGGSIAELECFLEAVNRLLTSMMKEAEWTKTGYTPSMQEYMEIRKTSIALEPIVLIPLYFVGPKLSEQIIHHNEYSNLMQLVNVCGRLLNDIQSYKRERERVKEPILSGDTPEKDVDDHRPDCLKWRDMSRGEGG
ncbi:hypothetical protein KI387_026015, partial [Taxus chinensis]